MVKGGAVHVSPGLGVADESWPTSRGPGARSKANGQRAFGGRVPSTSAHSGCGEGHEHGAVPCRALGDIAARDPSPQVLVEPLTSSTGGASLKQ
jgi:hypothetical protein